MYFSRIYVRVDTLQSLNDSGDFIDSLGLTSPSSGHGELEAGWMKVEKAQEADAEASFLCVYMMR